MVHIFSHEAALDFEQNEFERAKMKRIVVGGALFGILFGLQGSAFAASPANPATATFQVQITIVKQCLVTTPANINLGTWGASDPISTGVSGTTTFNVTCSNSIPYTIAFSSPNDLPSVGGTTHVMKGAATGNTNTVQYQLTDATAGATFTGALGGSSPNTIAGTGTGVAVTKTIKATVFNYTAPVTPDTYTDTVTLAVSY
jgi:spore coat protein U-like protein